MMTNRHLFLAAAIVVVVGGGVLLHCANREVSPDVRGSRLWELPRRPGTGVRALSGPTAAGPSSGAGLRVGAAVVTDASHPPVEDRFAAFQPTALRMGPADRAGVRRRERLVNASAKYPCVRVEDTLSVDPVTGVETLWHQLAMAGDHVMVRLRAGHARPELETAVARHGFAIRKAMQAPGCFLVCVAPASLDSVPALTNALSREACLDVAEPDYLVHVAETTPNDPSYSLLWGMQKIEMPRVWDMTTGTGGVVVAIFDTGTDLDHPDLVDNIWVNPLEIAGNDVDDDENGYVDDVNGWDFYADDNDPNDVEDHGSHVAGTIGAVGDNRLGVAGVGWHVRLMTIKFFGKNPMGQLEGYASDATAGMYYVITQRTRGVPIRVTNHSWGGSGYSQILKDAMAIAGGQGILHVTAAGNNDNLDNDAVPHYPSSYTLSNLLAVANTTQGDGLNSVSHYGATSVDLGAPGVSVYSTYLAGGFAYKSGTSMSSPHVAGVAALMFDYMPELSWQQVRASVLAGVDPVASLRGKCTTGGRLNAYGAFAAVAPQLTHTPLENTTAVGVAHTLEARIHPGVPILDTNRVVVLWNTTGSTQVFVTNVMQHVSNDLFRATIPGQSRGTAIHYMIQAETMTGRRATFPVGAPADLHSFDVTYPVKMLVFGYPANTGTVTPDYGTREVPWGRTVTATASLYAPQTADHRFRCSGWYGGGSVPPGGSSNSVSFVIRDISAIQWNWQEQYALTQDSLPADIVGALEWWDAGAAAKSVVAPSGVEQSGVRYAFANWLVEGQRYPDATRTARNPVTGLTMLAARHATAVYVPEAQDEDSDGLPDWWERFNFANLDSAATNDPDGDGYSNAAELADFSDPRDAASMPAGPVITHVALPDPMATLSPWTLTATVTDRAGVASVQLVWQRNGQPWVKVPMVPGADDVYTGTIPSPHALADQFAYRIEAGDTALNASTTTIHAFRVAYPLASVTPAALEGSLRPKGVTTVPLMLVNDGNADLVWRLLPDWRDEVVADGGLWTHSGANDQWHVTTQEVHSASHAWYCGNDATREYADSMDASLVTPPVVLGSEPRLTFWHWPEMEYDGRVGFKDYYWDGGVVDVSTNGGASFERLVPVGGYPHKITPNPDSPFPAHTPCFGGTGGWQFVTFDLAAYAGETVAIRFRFGSDRYTVARGWFLDDVQFSWGASWLGLEATSGVVAASSTAVLPVTLNAIGLRVADYRGALPLVCNDPTRAMLAVPVWLHVTDTLDTTSIQLAEDVSDALVVSWPSMTGRVYNLMLSTSLQNAAGWVGVPNYTNLPGVEGTMSYTGTLDRVPSKFYRINESVP